MWCLLARNADGGSAGRGVCCARSQLLQKKVERWAFHTKGMFPLKKDRSSQSFAERRVSSDDKTKVQLPHPTDLARKRYRKAHPHTAATSSLLLR